MGQGRTSHVPLRQLNLGLHLRLLKSGFGGRTAFGARGRRPFQPEGIASRVLLSAADELRRQVTVPHVGGSLPVLSGEVPTTRFLVSHLSSAVAVSGPIVAT